MLSAAIAEPRLKPLAVEKTIVLRAKRAQRQPFRHLDSERRPSTHSSYRDIKPVRDLPARDAMRSAALCGFSCQDLAIVRKRHRARLTKQPHFTLKDVEEKVAFLGSNDRFDRYNIMS